MLTKARLDQYIKDGELVPIGTELETIELGKCVVVELYKKDTPYLIKLRNNEGRWNVYTSDLRLNLNNIHTSLIDPSPEAANNEFPCEMEVSDDGINWHKAEVKCLLDGQFVTNKDAGFGGYYVTWNHARPIPPKVKTLADLKEGDEVWVIKAFKNVDFGIKIFFDSINIKGDYIFKDSKSLIGIFKSELTELVSLTPPTPAQIATAKQAAIEEVEKRFAELEKGVQG